MANRERVNRRAVTLLHSSAEQKASGKTNYVDAKGADALSFIIAAGTTGATSAKTYTVTLEHADETPGTAGSYSAVPATQVHGAAVVDDDNQVHQLAYVGNKRYVRASIVVNGLPDGPVQILAVGENLAQADYPEGVTLTTGTVA